MAIRDSGGVKYASFAEGVDNTTSVDSPEIKGTLSQADNTDLVDESLAKNRNGYSPISTWSTYQHRAGLEYKNVNGNRENLVYAEAATLTGNSGIFGKFTGVAAPTTLLSGLADGIKPTIIQFRSLAFVLNGRDSVLYDGTTTRQIGISEPTVAPTFVSNIAGDQVISGSYLYAYSYYNSATGAESNLSPFSDTMTSGATASQAGFQINFTAGNSSTADKIRIYRSVSGGNIVFRETEVTISTTTYASTLVDSGLGTEAELDNSRLSEPALFGVVSDNRMFCAGFASNPNRVQFSKVGISGPMPESFQALDFVDCNLNDGDEIVGLGRAGDNVVVIKERSVGRLIRITASTGGLERQGSQKYVYEETSAQVTGLAHNLILSLDNIVIWFGRDDIYGTDGTQIFRFAKRVRKTLKALDFNFCNKWSVINKTDTQQIIFAVTRENKTECDYQFVGHYRNFPKIAFTFYTSGVNTSTHPGLVVGSLFEVTSGGSKKFYFGSADGTGIVHQFDVGGSDNSLGIYWDLRLPWDSGENPSALKTFHSVYCLVAGSGVSPNNTITMSFEKNTNNTTVTTVTKKVISTNVLWNGSGVNWASFNWSTANFGPLRFYPHRKAYFGRYGFSNTYANQPLAIRAISSITQKLPIGK